VQTRAHVAGVNVAAAAMTSMVWMRARNSQRENLPLRVKMYARARLQLIREANSFAAA